MTRSPPSTERTEASDSAAGTEPSGGPDSATETEAELRDQFTRAFEGASYPLLSPFDLIPALPDGPETEFAANGVTIPAIELGMVHGDHLSFPYESTAALVDDVVAALRADGVLPASTE